MILHFQKVSSHLVSEIPVDRGGGILSFPPESCYVVPVHNGK